MNQPQNKLRFHRKGVACILAMLLLGVFVCLATALIMTADRSLQQSDNFRDVQSARSAAESGLEYMTDVMKSTRLSASTTEETLLEELAAALGDRFNSTPNLAGQVVTNSGTAVLIPDIQGPYGTFRCNLSPIDANLCRMEIEGSDGSGVSRRLTMDFQVTVTRPAVFDYGLASKGQILIHGNAEIIGVNDPAEASVLSATVSETDAILIDGHITISGDLYAAGDGAEIVITGTPEIAGSTDPAVYMDNLHVEVDAPDFPEMDTAPLAALATSTIDATTDISKGGVFNNVRIAAGTNPVFSNDVVLNGIVYIEAPNIVRFEAKATLNGMVVTQDNDLPIESCQLHFAGNVEANGVEALPDTPEFEAVKQETGTFIAAPGFGVTFSGNFSAINGCIAADQLTFTGTAEGTIRGSVIGLKDLPTEIGGNVRIYVDRYNVDTNPAGFVNSLAFAPIPDTYEELTKR